MENGIGPTLRDARSRRKVDLSAVEASTKIRIRYLRALENEEWGQLPGGAYTRSFIRTYASYLGLDGDRLVDEYKRSLDPSPVGSLSRSEPLVPPRKPRVAPRLSRGAWGAIVGVGLIVVLVVIGSQGGGKTSRGKGGSSTQAGGTQHPGAAAASQGPKQVPGVVSVRLAATADVWVCLLDEKGRALVDGQILGTGAEEGPFHSGSFTVSFGNGEVSMMVDGQEASIPATSSPIGYSIDSSGNLQQLPDSQRPTCT